MGSFAPSMLIYRTSDARVGSVWVMMFRGDEDGPIAYTSTYVVINDLRLPTR